MDNDCESVLRYLDKLTFPPFSNDNVSPDRLSCCWSEFILSKYLERSIEPPSDKDSVLFDNESTWDLAWVSTNVVDITPFEIDIPSPGENFSRTCSVLKVVSTWIDDWINSNFCSSSSWASFTFESSCLNADWTVIASWI